MSSYAQQSAMFDCKSSTVNENAPQIISSLTYIFNMWFNCWVNVGSLEYFVAMYSKIHGSVLNP